MPDTVDIIDILFLSFMCFISLFNILFIWGQYTIHGENSQALLLLTTHLQVLFVVFYFEQRNLIVLQKASQWEPISSVSKTSNSVIVLKAWNLTRTRPEALGNLLILLGRRSLINLGLVHFIEYEKTWLITLQWHSLILSAFKTELSKVSKVHRVCIYACILCDNFDFPTDFLCSQGPPYVHKEKLCKKVSDTSIYSLSSCKITTLLLVVHGGSQLDCDQDSLSKEMDCELLRESFETVIKTHYRGAVGRIAIRLVECPAVCSKALGILSHLCPYVENDSGMFILFVTPL